MSNCFWSRDKIEGNMLTISSHIYIYKIVDYKTCKQGKVVKKKKKGLIGIW